jgi:hypothetical protein
MNKPGGTNSDELLTSQIFGLVRSVVKLIHPETSGSRACTVHFREVREIKAARPRNSGALASECESASQARRRN